MKRCYSAKIVLHCPRGPAAGLEYLVRAFVKHSVRVVAIVGTDCSRVEQVIDEIVRRVDANTRSLLAINYCGESVAAAVEMMRCMTGDYEGDEVQVIELLHPRVH